MLRKNLSQPTLIKPARISMTKKLPSDFFLQVESPKTLPFKRHRKLLPINDENREISSSKTTDNQSLAERKISFQFTFYRSSSRDENRQPFEVKREKSSKIELLEKFNIKLPYIVKSAESGQERRKKLVKVRRQNNFTKDFLQEDTFNQMR